MEASAIGPAHDGLSAGSGHALLLAGHETGTTQMVSGIGTQHLRLALGTGVVSLWSKARDEAPLQAFVSRVFTWCST